jgi:hypothetical protein
MMKRPGLSASPATVAWPMSESEIGGGSQPLGIPGKPHVRDRVALSGHR